MSNSFKAYLSGSMAIALLAKPNIAVTLLALGWLVHGLVSAWRYIKESRIKGRLQ